MKVIVPRLVKLICFLPIVFLLLSVLLNQLGPDPATELAKRTGEWALRFLLLSLSITPVRQLLGLGVIAPYRRTFGLFALLYAVFHFATYVVFILQFRWVEIVEDILERPYITVGFASFCILAILGATSTKSMIKRLGRKWKSLHRMVYLASILAIVHLLWILRSDIAEAVFYAMILLPNLGYRFFFYMSKRKI